MNKRQNIDTARELDINRMVKLGAIKATGRRIGSWVWCDALTGEHRSNIVYDKRQ
jgi:hypothetical protein